MRAAPRAATPDPTLRILLLAIAEAAIDALDALDPDPEREPEPDEDDDERDLVTA